jgi:uncharacterized membrane protein (UPF0136 family)
VKWTPRRLRTKRQCQQLISTSWRASSPDARRDFHRPALQCSLQHVCEKKKLSEINAPDSYRTVFESLIWQHYLRKHESNEHLASVLRVTNEYLIARALMLEGVEDMFGLIAAVLIVLWLLGFFAFHVTTGFIHVALVLGIVLLAFHLLRGRSSEA